MWVGTEVNPKKSLAQVTGFQCRPPNEQLRRWRGGQCCGCGACSFKPHYESLVGDVKVRSKRGWKVSSVDRKIGGRSEVRWEGRRGKLSIRQDCDGS